MVVVKGKAQTREGQTSLLADSIQNHVDVAIAVNDEGRKLQKPLLDLAPTINGVHMPAGEEDTGDDADFNADFNGGFAAYDDDELGPVGEESPFRQEPPEWLGAPAPSQEQPAQVAPTQANSTKLAPTQAVAQPAGLAENGAGYARTQDAEEALEAEEEDGMNENARRKRE